MNEEDEALFVVLIIFFILGFIDRIPKGILNINIFKTSVGDSVHKVKVKCLIRTKPFKYYQLLFILQVKSEQSTIRKSINYQRLGIHISSVISSRNVYHS
jgi:hypothetical protein